MLVHDPLNLLVVLTACLIKQVSVAAGLELDEGKQTLFLVPQSIKTAKLDLADFGAVFLVGISEASAVRVVLDVQRSTHPSVCVVRRLVAVAVQPANLGAQVDHRGWWKITTAHEGSFP